MNDSTFISDNRKRLQRLTKKLEKVGNNSTPRESIFHSQIQTIRDDLSRSREAGALIRKKSSDLYKKQLEALSISSIS